jgi:hypothetical protein
MASITKDTHQPAKSPFWIAVSMESEATVGLGDLNEVQKQLTGNWRRN